MKNRKLPLILAAFLSLTLLSACGEDEGEKPITPIESTTLSEQSTSDTVIEQDASDTSESIVTLTPEEIPDYITIKGNQYSTLLTELNLRYKKLTDADIEPLKYMVNLTYLDLSLNSIKDISPLAGLTNLTELILSNNKIFDISPLAELTNLTRLHLYENQIIYIDALVKLCNLEDLSLTENQINDISALYELTNLTQLQLYGNFISDEQVESLKSVLVDCEISNS